MSQVRNVLQLIDYTIVDNHNCCIYTDLPPLVVNIATDGLLLTSQSFTFECTASLVDGLLQPPSLELVAPNGTTLAQGSGTTTLQYSLLSLDISDGGEYTCIINLTIPGSGIDRQVSATESITVVGMSFYHSSIYVCVSKSAVL